MQATNIPDSDFENHLAFNSHNYQISEKAFGLFKELIYEKAGITLSAAKRTLVVSRLSKRMRELKIISFEDYYEKVISNSSELQLAIDSLTTNETYFFREDKHFDFLKKNILSKTSSGNDFKVWSAASSTGEEAYSTAMVLADKFGFQSNWQIIGTDINQNVLTMARKGLYPLIESEKIPRNYLTQYCLKGMRSQSEMMLMDSKLKSHTSFEFMNLNADWPSQISNFDVVFLRNVMIYFDLPTKQRLVDKIANKIKPGGYLFIGHSETLNQVSNRFKVVQPAICQKVR